MSVTKTLCAPAPSHPEAMTEAICTAGFFAGYSRVADRHGGGIQDRLHAFFEPRPHQHDALDAHGRNGRLFGGSRKALRHLPGDGGIGVEQPAERGLAHRRDIRCPQRADDHETLVLRKGGDLLGQLPMDQERVMVESLCQGCKVRGDVFGTQRLRGCLLGQVDGERAQFITEIELGSRELLGEQQHHLGRQTASLGGPDERPPDLRHETDRVIAATAFKRHTGFFESLPDHEEKHLAQGFVGPLLADLGNQDVEDDNDGVRLLGQGEADGLQFGRHLSPPKIAGDALGKLEKLGPGGVRRGGHRGFVDVALPIDPTI
ncbi:hypothetical protein [Methylobacterium sp. J-077]|uniref:hypothetical protein n=1 Tax=Methylobacterium sp. J-077 TaxID=2836656 RepID=UPI001FB9136F|nr:hypothetical protein [Methylobacterium sp. J-077]MCJ2121912.1 hypothetical protein [Methylobacterium sp. J-077]